MKAAPSTTTKGDETRNWMTAITSDLEGIGLVETTIKTFSQYGKSTLESVLTRVTVSKSDNPRDGVAR